MKIAINDVAADRSGALSVLRAVHAAAQRHPEHDWLFLASRPELAESEHVRVRRFPWVKRSWLHRVLFDFVVAPCVLREEQPDIVVSLQNLATPRVRRPQVIYLHNALPFSGYRFSLTKNPKLWLYQKLITRRILESVRSAESIVVQAPWIKEAVVAATDIEPNRVTVIRPTVPLPPTAQRYESTSETRRRFFYPVEAIPYKKHALIFEAVEQLEREGVDVEVACTISPSDLARLGIDHVPGSIRLLGRIPFDEVQRRYTESVLLFPSVLETVGLPLMEAQASQTFALAADLPYARDVLAGYENAYFFDPADPEDLASLMTSVADGSLPHSGTPAPRSLGELDPWDEFIRVVTNR